MNKEEFINEVNKLRINLSSHQLQQLDKYYNLLISENEKINLTSITAYNDVLLKHFYDSLTISKVVDLNNQRICDVGTGAGLPGIVLKIAFPNLQVVLVESITKKCLFLQKVIDTLELKDIMIVNKRAEEYSKDNKEYFDIITSRAVARLNILLELSSSSLKVGGYYIALKGNIEEEINNIASCLDKLNLKIDTIEKFTLPNENSIRNIIKIQKIKPTNNIYPRKYNDIKKNPL